MISRLCSHSWWGASIIDFRLLVCSFVVPIMLLKNDDVAATINTNSHTHSLCVSIAASWGDEATVQTETERSMVQWHWNALKWIVRSTDNNIRVYASNSIQVIVCVCAFMLEPSAGSQQAHTRHRTVLGHFRIHSGYPHSLISWYYIILSKARPISYAERLVFCVSAHQCRTYSEYYVSYSNLRAEINVTDSINMIGIFVIVLRSLRFYCVFFPWLRFILR